MPLVWADHPAARLVIAGQRPPRTIQRLARDRRIDVVGLVPDFASFYADVGVALVPLRFGGGTPTKILEPMAMGVPVVATDFACRGMPGAAEVLHTGNSPEALAAQVLAILANPEVAHEQTTAAVQYVVRGHSLSAVRDRLRVVLHTAHAA